MTGAFNLLSEEWPLARKQEPHTSNPVFQRTALRHHECRSEDSHLSGVFSLRASTAPAPADERRRVLEKAPGLSSRSADGGSSSARLQTPAGVFSAKWKSYNISLFFFFFRISFHLHAEQRKGEKTREKCKFWRVCRTGGRTRWQSRWKQPWLSWFLPRQVSKPLKIPHLKHLKKDRPLHDASSFSLSWNTICLQCASA